MRPFAQRTRGPRLWMFNHYAVAPTAAGGTRHYSLARAVVGAGGQATIFASGYNPSTGVSGRLRPGQAAHTQTFDGVRFVWLRTTPYRGNTVFRMLNMVSYVVMVSLAELGRPSPDVVMGSTVHPFAALAGWWVARRRGARFVYEIRDLWPQTLIDIGALSPRSPLARVLWAIESFLVRHSDVVVTLLPGVASYLEGRGLPTEHVHYLPNGADLSLADAADGSTEWPGTRALEIEAVERAREEGRVVFTYLGAHGRVNALHTVLEAFARAQQRSEVPMILLMVGDGPEKPVLQELAQEMGLSNVSWLEPIPKTSVPRFLTAVDVGIIHATKTPVYRYGISFNKLFDYMAASLPVIFACTSMNDPVAASGGGLSCPPDQPDVLADAMVALAQLSGAERRAMGDAGRAFVSASHDMNKLGAEFVSMLWPGLRPITSGAPQARAGTSGYPSR